MMSAKMAKMAWHGVIIMAQKASAAAEKKTGASRGVVSARLHIGVAACGMRACAPRLAAARWDAPAHHLRASAYRTKYVEMLWQNCIVAGRARRWWQ